MEERKSRADEVDESQSFRKDESSTSGSDNWDLEQLLDQQAKCQKIENKKPTDKLSPQQQFKMNFISGIK